MSEIKVNKITPRTACGTTTLGDSGDTFTVASGATIQNLGTATGFGGTGVVSWETGSIKTTGFTAVTGTGYFCDTTGGAFTVTLPLSPSAGDVVGVSDYAKTFDTNNLTLGRNSSNIGGVAKDSILTTEGIAVTLVYVDVTKGWIVTDSGLQSDAPGPIFVAATGGCITTCGNYKTHTFLSPNTFVVTCAGNTAGSETVDYLIVAGGGSGGGANGGGGGGGAGGFRFSNSTCMPAPLTSPLAACAGAPVTATPYAITVGAGAASITGNQPPTPGEKGNTGSDSSALSYTATGGGGGGGSGLNCTGLGRPGGSGGGGGGQAYVGPGGSGNTPATTPAQGQNGGATISDASPSAGHAGSGGGGAGAIGTSNAPADCAGPGGIGSFVVQAGFAGCNGTTGPVGSTRYFAGGGGANSDTAPVPAQGTGGAGGGGAGAVPSSSATAGGTNTGGGGGGVDSNPSGQTSGAGGSGIVMIRYKYQ